MSLRRAQRLFLQAMKVDIKAVKALRDKTGAGMMDAKKALLQSEGNMDKAVEYLRKKGLASADKKAGRVAAEGLIASYIHAGSRSAPTAARLISQSLTSSLNYPPKGGRNNA